MVTEIQALSGTGEAVACFSESMSPPKSVQSLHENPIASSAERASEDVRHFNDIVVQEVRTVVDPVVSTQNRKKQSASFNGTASTRLNRQSQSKTQLHERFEQDEIANKS